MEPLIKNKWAILIGVNEYEHVKSLKYCANDVACIKQEFHEYLGFPIDHFIEFSDTAELKPERDDIFHHIGDISTKKTIQPDDLLVFYFTGHGIMDKNDQKDYLLPRKASPASLKYTGIKFEDLTSELKRTDCKHIVMFIDACREAFEGGKGIISIGNDCKSIVKRHGIVTFFSCDPKDQSFEIDELKHGSFTQCILDAIKDSNYNTIGEVEKYLRRHVPLTNEKYNKPAQKPWAEIAPADMIELPIFLSASQLQQSKDILDDMEQQLGNLYNNKLLNDYCFSKALEALELAEKGAKDASIIRKIELIKKVVTEEITPHAFRVAFLSLERQPLEGPIRKKQLGVPG